MKDRCIRQEIESRESQLLAPYAALASASRGRTWPQPEHPLRTAYQRDRDRIVHSSAFRRMEYKTQVFIPHETDHFRTRLTHTIEVAQISRTIARSLRLNEDLAEAIALVHDLGHTPFGHSGETVLNRLLSDCGGFNHNRQSLRIVDLLEQRYPNHPGLNLTYEVREGIIKHETSADISMNEFNPHEHPTLEAALVDISDEIAYNSHDIDDGISSGILTPEMLGTVKFIASITGTDKSGWSEGNLSRDHLVRTIIDCVATDLIEETSRRLNDYNIANMQDVRRSPEKLVGNSAPIAAGMKELKRFLSANLYRHEKMKSMSEWAGEIIQTLYEKILSDPSIMSLRYQERLETDSPEQVVADYIAGMTDRFATQLYERLE